MESDDDSSCTNDAAEKNLNHCQNGDENPVTSSANCKEQMSEKPGGVMDDTMDMFASYVSSILRQLPASKAYMLQQQFLDTIINARLEYEKEQPTKPPQCRCFSPLPPMPVLPSPGSETEQRKTYKGKKRKRSETVSSVPSQDKSVVDIKDKSCANQSSCQLPLSPIKIKEEIDVDHFEQDMETCNVDPITISASTSPKIAPESCEIDIEEETDLKPNFELVFCGTDSVKVEPSSSKNYLESSPENSIHENDRTSSLETDFLAPDPDLAGTRLWLRDRVFSESDSVSSGLSDLEEDCVVDDVVEQQSELSADDSDVEDDPCNAPRSLQPHPARRPTHSLPLWSQQIQYVEPREFLSDFGPCHSLPVGATAKDYCDLLLGGDEFYENLVAKTNLFAERKQTENNKRDTHWTPVTKEEIMAYIGIDIYMGLYDLPDISEYFLPDTIVCPKVQQAMTFRRWKKINQYFHVNDPSQAEIPGTENYDILLKVRPLLTIIDNFRNFYKPNRDIVVDEAMIGFKGRFCLKQYMPKKPTKWGIKVWASVCSTTGYFLFGDIYLGKKHSTNSDCLLGEQAVLSVTKPFLGKHHHIYYDNFFSSYNLCNILLEKDTYACGTVRTNRFGWPEEFKKTKTLKLSRGQSVYRQSGNVVATVWRNKKSDVKFFSTNSDPRVISQIKKKTGRGNERILVDCPQVVSSYTKNMGAVNRSDQYRSYYGFGRPSKKWWKYLYHFIVNTVIVNSYVIFKLTNQPMTSKNGFTQLQFRKELVDQFIGNFSSRQKVGRKRSLPAGIASPESSHKLEKLTHGVVCIVCRSNGRKTDSGRAIRTHWKCKHCDAPFCKNPCFLVYHQEKGVDIG